MRADRAAVPTSKSAGGQAGCGTWRLSNLRCIAARGIAGLTLALFILGPSCFADTIRVTTWNLEPATVAGTASTATGTNELRIREAAAALKQLDPDVILLQQVRDWKMCGQLAQALKPADYSVLVCSSFREARTGALSEQQAAILAKRKAYFSWSEPWHAQGEAALPGGFAFAAVQVGKQRVGFFSVQAGTVVADARGAGQRAAWLQARAAAIGQVLEQVGSVKSWVANRVQVFVVAGTFDPDAQDAPVRLLDQAGFGDAFLQTPTADRVTVPGKPGQPGATADYIFTQPAACATNPRILSTAGSAHYPVACDVELDPTAIAAAQATRVAAAPTPQPPPSKPEPLPPPKDASNHHLTIAAAVAALVALAAAVWVFARRRRALSPPTPVFLSAADGAVPSSYTVVVGTRSATELAPADPRSAPVRPPRPIIHLETPGATQTHAEVLRQRALAAEQRAERANAVIRTGLIPHLGQWLKQKLVRKLITDRTQLLRAQEAATLKALAVDERLARIEQQIQRQNSAYQERIESLTRELIVAKEESRELIRARISQVKAEMEAARARLMAQSSPDEDPRG